MFESPAREFYTFPANFFPTETLPGKYGTGRKKKAPLPPATEQKAATKARVERSQSDLVRSKTRSSDSTEESAASKNARPFLSYKVKVSSGFLFLTNV